MGFFAMILAAAAAIGVWMYRAERASDAARTVLDMAGDAKAAARRFGYRRRTKSNPLDDIDDPRLSAAGMLVAAAKLDGDLSRDQIDRVTRECVENFEVNAAEAADMTAFGRWLAQQGEPEEVIRRLARGLRSKMTPEQHESLFEMLNHVASVEGGSPSERQTLAFDVARRTLG